ncbi:hypothetical protein O5O45_08800 [Hahella aquimaris]|uniref:hypothetical protein n=1 Tax=Hahella sp. HNIBRBA332 TaxID=3015983 RepID=UPI00273C9F86|nr:hypothetical protein [Hahella sp. HNIBRBA332]WLQ16011.1 hypothetical protein O5O45_08800 [Hahella sp. HNIBRBA332]
MIMQLPKRLLTGKGPAFSRLTAKECSIGDYRLRYQLPGNAIDIGIPKKPNPSHLNLNNDLLATYECDKEFNRTFVQMGFEWWAYRGFFLQGSFGQLGRMSLHVDVNRAEPHAPISEDDLDSLEPYLKQEYWTYYETEETGGGINLRARQHYENNKVLMGDTPVSGFLVKLPDPYTKERIHGVDWLAYHINSEGMAGHHHTYYWAYPLSKDYYLTVSFWMQLEIGNRSMRSERMRDDARRIMSMMELYKS